MSCRVVLCCVVLCCAVLSAMLRSAKQYVMLGAVCNMNLDVCRLPRVVLKAGMPECRNAGMPECRNAGNQDPKILKPGMTFREGKRAKQGTVSVALKPLILNCVFSQYRRSLLSRRSVILLT